MNRRRFWILVIVIHLVFFGKQLIFEHSLLQDSKEYLYAAENLIHSHTLYAGDLSEKFNPNFLTKRPVLFPLIIAFFKLISFGNPSLFWFLILLIQNIISLYCIKLVEKIILHFKGAFNYKIAFIFLLFTPAQAIYANFIMSEIWLQLILVYILNCLIFNQENLKKIGLLSGLCIAAIALKPVMIFLAFCLPLFTLFLLKTKTKALHLVVSLLPVLFVFTVSKWNEKRTGYFQYSSISTINLLQYNTYTLLINKYGVTKADSIVDNIQYEADKTNTYALKQHFIAHESSKIIKENIGNYLYLHLRGMVFCIMDPGRFDISQFFNLPHRQSLLYETSKKNNTRQLLDSFVNPLGILLMLILIINIMKVFVVLKFLISKSVQLNQKLLLLFFPIYIVILTGPIGSSRFSMPFFPIVLIIILMTVNLHKNESSR